MLTGRLSVSDLRGSLVPAVPIPHDAAGRPHVDGLVNYSAWLAGFDVAGVAVRMTRGGGSPEEEAEILAVWRDAFGGRRVVVGIGPSPDERRPDRLAATAVERAGRAAEGGADALIVWPPTSLRGRADAETSVLEYHTDVASVGLPLLPSYLGEGAGGIAYGPHLLAQLLARPEVIGVLVAPGNVATFQDVAHLVRDLVPDKVVVGGEERFLGYSLLAGADALLSGLAAAFPEAVSGLLKARDGDPARMIELIGRVDNLARMVFRAPIGGATRRLLWCLAHRGVIPPEAAHDPGGTPLGRREFDQIGETLRRLGFDRPET